MRRNVYLTVIEPGAGKSVVALGAIEALAMPGRVGSFQVARSKLPASPVAGRATAFVFPDPNTGNNTYKAVQRSAGAVAGGPVLQGLRQPVNDLSPGTTVADIVNTVAITAIQAQGCADAHRPADA
jgi:phosphate acetyltransferase